MRTFITLLFVVALGIAAVGFYRGWFTVSRSASSDATEITATVNREQIARDTAQWRRRIAEQLEEFERRIQELSAKASEAGAETKEKVEQEITELREKQETVRTELRDVPPDDASSRPGMKERIDSTMDELKRGLDRVMSRFR